MASIAELYQDPDRQHDVFYERTIARQGPIENSLGQLGELALISEGPALATQLDLLPEDDDHHHIKGRVAAFLGCLPARTLLDNFGAEVAMWTLANDAYYRRGALYAGLEAEGYDPILLNASRLQSQRRDQVTPGRNVLAQYHAMRLILGTGLSAIDLPAQLDNAARPDVWLSERRLSDYALIPVHSDMDMHDKIGGKVRNWKGKGSVEKRPQKPGQGLGLVYDMWLDVHAGFMLTYKQAPQLLVGLETEGTDELMIAQWQRQLAGIYNPAIQNENGNFPIMRYRAPRGLQPLDWPKLAVGIVAQLADHLGMSFVGIREATKVRSRDCAIPIELAQDVYDDNAWGARLHVCRPAGRLA